MRRSAKYIAGVLLATGASLAFAGPASAHSGNDIDDIIFSEQDTRITSVQDNDSFAQFGLVNLGGLGLGLFGNGSGFSS